MRTLTRKPKQLTLAVAALAIVAVAAVMLLAGSSPAQAKTATVARDSNDVNGAPRPLATTTPPRHATPEACPAEGQAARTVDSGHIALFDVYWNPDEGELTNNPCPPTVTHVPAQEDRGGHPARDDRSPSSIDIGADPPTIIHIPNSAKVNLNTDTTYPATKYPKVKKADDLEDRDADGDGTLDGVGDGMVWVLPACPPDGDPTAVGLCLSFSSALLKDADWENSIEFQVDHVHQIDIDKQDPRYVLVYDVSAAPVAAEPLWNSSDVRKSKVSVAPGGYKRPLWFFTDRGTYEFQVHITGEPDDTEASKRDDGLDPVSDDASVSSDVRDYIVHVGAEADLGVEVSAEEASTGVAPLEPGDNVTVTVTASNAGPSEAPNTEVKVGLPSGLMSPTVDTVTKGTYSNGVWTIGSMCKTTVLATNDKPECPHTATLTMTATVDANTHGQDLTVKATISATEPVKITETVDGQKIVKTHHVPVPDPTPGNDMDMDTVTVVSSTNADPVFQITRSVPENSAVGAVVGDAIEVYQNGESDSVTYSLISGAPHFAVASDSDGNAQVTVAQTTLDYETKDSYHAIIGVSDGLNAGGNSDSTVDNRIAVLVNVTDVDERPSRSIAENSASGSNVGAAVVTGLAGSNPAPTYTLAGDGHGDFSVATDTDGNAQISVSTTAMLDYELQSDYDLFINNNSNSDQVEVLISVTNVTEALNNGAPTVTISAEDTTLTVGDTANLKVSVGDLPAGTVFGSFLWEDNWHRNSDNAEADWEALAQSTDPAYAYNNPANRGETIRFRVIMAYWDGENTGTVRFATSNIISVEWQEAGSES